MTESLFYRPALLATLLIPFTSAAIAAVIGNVSAVGDSISLDTERTRMLDANYQALADRKGQKERQVDELLAGRVTFRETAANFIAIHRSDVTNWLNMRQVRPDLSDEKWAAQNVFHYLENRFIDRPELAMATEQLGFELAAYLAEVE